MKESGLTSKQIMIMKLIAHNKEMTVKRLCEEMGLTKSTVSGIVQRLEDADYVSKVKRETDQRNTYIIFSEKGKQFALEFKTAMNESFLALFKDFSKDEMNQINEALDLLTTKLKEEVTE